MLPDVLISSYVYFQSQDYDQIENALFLKEQESLKSEVSTT